MILLPWFCDLPWPCVVRQHRFARHGPSSIPADTVRQDDEWQDDEARPPVRPSQPMASMILPRRTKGTGYFEAAGTSV